MGAALKFKQERVARQSGEIARLKVVQGPDLGSVFIVTGNRVVIGRGEDCDVVLSDLKTSRHHAELVQSQSGWVIQDMGSANGIAYNGRGVKNSSIKTKDTISLGDTILEFVSAESGTLMLVSSATTPAQIQSEQENLDQQRARIRAMSKFGGLAKNVPRPDQLTQAISRTPPPVSNLARKIPFNAPPGFDPKRLLLIAAVLVGGYFLIMDNPPRAKKPSKKDDESRDLASYLPATDSPVVERTAELFFKNGFREYNVGNYLRARTQFENVLQMSPGHPLAKLYLANSNLRIEEEVKNHLDLGRKDFEAGKLKAARGHYEAIQRLLFRDPTNPAFAEAADQLKRIAQENHEVGS